MRKQTTIVVIGILRVKSQMGTYETDWQVIWPITTTCPNMPLTRSLLDNPQNGLIAVHARLSTCAEVALILNIE